MSLDGRKAFVTGASGGLGRSIARGLASAGADVGIGYHLGTDRAENVAEDLRSMGRRCHPVSFDQSDANSIQAAVIEVDRALGGLDILVNNAAVAKAVPFPDLESLDADLWDWTMSHNLRGPYLLARSAAPLLRSSPSGHIVNIAAMAGLKPMGASIAQSVSKAAVIQMTRALAVVLAPDVRVTALPPGLMEGTELTKNIPEAFAAGFRDLSVLGATTDIEDVTRQVVTYCESETVTGQTAVVDGGVHFH